MMFSFPPILDGNAGVKLSNNADSGFPKPNIGETFYSIKDGNWSDATIWQTASGRVGLLPTANDDVYVRNAVNVFGQNATFNCNNLFIIGALNFNAFVGTTVTLIVNGNINSIGTINLNGTGFQNILSLLGTNNYIGNLTTSSIGIVQYARIGNQDILDLPYSNLIITNAGTKKPTNNLTITGNLTVSNNAIFDLWWYDLTVSGTTSIQGGNTSTIKKSYFGNIIFIGNVTFGNGLGQCDFRGGNPNIEFRSGFGIGTSNPNVNSIYTGTGTWTFTTNNQSLTSWTNTFPINLDANFIIANGITVTVASSMYMQLSGTINGAGATSKLLMASGAILNFATLTSVSSMTVGTWDFTTNANTIQYNGNYSATIPSYFTTFSSLTISGTGTKTTGANVTTNANVSVGQNSNLTLGGNLSITGNLTLNGVASTQNSCYLECGNYNLSVNGTTSGTGGCSLTKTGAGSLLFVGAFNFSQLFSRLLFTGNPTVEFRNGFAFAGGSGLASDCGTGLWSFTTNSQTINLAYAGNFTFNNVQIVGAITVTYNNIGSSCILTIANSINGTVAGSTFVSAAILGGLLITSPSTVIMSTGVFDITTNPNNLIYNTTSNLTLPYSSYYNLQILGSGTKTLSSNTTILGNLTLSQNAGTVSILECSTYNLTVNGTTTLQTNGQFLKSGAGSLIFVGQVILFQIGFVFNLSGNPTVELRGGLSANTNGTFNTGTGQWTFSTASQAIASTAANLSMTFNCPILISGANTLSINNNSGTFTVTMLGLLNGDNVASTLRMGASSPTLNYQNATQPMATGILDTSTNLNTWIYGSGNQNVKGNPTPATFQQYRNLRFSGSGTTKTLQGNINVQNTYTVDAGVTVNLNGYTKTP